MRQLGVRCKSGCENSWAVVEVEELTMRESLDECETEEAYDCE